jgi:hypothetical protein
MFINRRTTVYVVFILIGLAMLAASLYRSKLFNTEISGAGGFGISPPYVKSDSLAPGGKYSQEITVMRGDTAAEEIVTAQIESADIASWISLEPSAIPFGKGEARKTVKVNVKVPEGILPGDYKAKIVLTLQSKKRLAGTVSIGLGARADVDLTVVGKGENYGGKIVNIGSGDAYDKWKGELIRYQEQVFYVHPDLMKAYGCDGQSQALGLLDLFARGISNEKLDKFPVGLANYGSGDLDGDGLSDMFETAIGTDINNADTDGDGYGDRMELENGYSPLVRHGALPVDYGFASKHKGRLFLQVENRGQAWYIKPSDNRRYYLPTDQLADLIVSLAVDIPEDEYLALVK